MALALAVSAWLLYGLFQNALYDRFLYVPIGLLLSTVVWPRFAIRRQRPRTPHGPPYVAPTTYEDGGFRGVTLTSRGRRLNEQPSRPALQSLKIGKRPVTKATATTVWKPGLSE